VLPHAAVVGGGVFGVAVLKKLAEKAGMALDY
jgi:hypothetical protein